MASEPALESRLRQEAQAKEAERKSQEAKLAALRAENCLRARSQIKLLDDGVRIARTNEKGEREILDDKGRAEETARTRKLVESECR